jgi:hypothetical protein
MPIPELMTWVPSRRRWTRMYKGKRYWISCKALGVPETKEASIQAANAWWKAKQAEVDSADQSRVRQLLPLEDLAGAVLGNVRALDDICKVIDVAWFTEEMQRHEKAATEEQVAEFPTVFDPETNTVVEPEPNYYDIDVDRRAAIRKLLIQLVDRCILGGQPLPEPMAAILPPARVQQVQAAVADLRGEPAVLPV